MRKTCLYSLIFLALLIPEFLSVIILLHSDSYNFFYFLFIWKTLYFTSHLENILVGQRILAILLIFGFVFFFSPFKMLFDYLLACILSEKKLVVSYLCFPDTLCPFPLVALRFSLCYWFLVIWSWCTLMWFSLFLFCLRYSEPLGSVFIAFIKFRKF